MDEVEESMSIEEEAFNFKTMGLDAQEMVKESQEIIDAIDSSDSDIEGMEELHREMIGIRDVAEQIAEKLG